MFLQNLVLAGEKGDKYGICWSGSGSHRKLITIYYTWLHHEVHDCHSSSNRRNIENTELIWNIASLFGRQSVDLSVAVSGNKYWWGSGGRRKLIATWGKFSAMNNEIWQTDLRNLGKFAVENCGPYYTACKWWLRSSLLINAAKQQSFIHQFHFSHLGVKELLERVSTLVVIGVGLVERSTVGEKSRYVGNKQMLVNVIVTLQAVTYSLQICQNVITEHMATQR